MSNHTYQYFSCLPCAGETLRHFARCLCGWRCPDQPSKQAAEDEVRKHEAVVERVRAHLSTATPTLKQQRDFYLMMSVDAEVEPKDRILWKRLADELTHRLNDGTPTQEQMALEWN